MAPEIKSDFRMEQAEMQSIVSGESVQVAAKHLKAFSVEWNVPIIMAGNEGAPPAGPGNERPPPIAADRRPAADPSARSAQLHGQRGQRAAPLRGLQL